MYNFCVHMYIFDVSFYSLRIAPTWYGLSYALGFIICYIFIKSRFSFTKKEHIDSLLTYTFFWIILGGRIGYAILYNLSFFLEYPLQLLYIWNWGMSFHGWLIGTIIGVYLFTRRYKYEFWKLIDTLAIVVPIALWLWRIWNWINNELPWYTPYDGPFAMYILWIQHFPSPLLEMTLEGIILFLIMILFYKYMKNRNPWFLSGVFLIGYSIARIIVEQFHLPDSHIWYIFWTSWLTLWILYTVPMILYGVYLAIMNFRR